MVLIISKCLFMKSSNKLTYPDACTHQLEKSPQPACFTKDMCLRVCGRDSKPTVNRSFLSYFTGPKQTPEE